MAPHPALLALLLLAAAHCALADDHDCIVGSPPLCNHSLASDPLCRGLYANNKTAWQSMDCDYVIYDVPYEEPTNKWIVIHAGVCDTDTEMLGDWASAAAATNLFGLRPCQGMDPETCTFNRSTCDALHVSWTMPSQPQALGLGFNPPQLIEVAKNKSNTLLFLHEYDGSPSYNWAHACNATWPAYVCIYADDPAFDNKFYGPGRIQELLAQMSNTEYLPCKIDVIDARNSSATPGTIPGPVWGEYHKLNRYPNLPCSGLFPQIQEQGWAWEMQGFVTTGLALAIMKEGDQNGTTGVLQNFKEAIEIALGPDPGAAAPAPAPEAGDKPVPLAELAPDAEHAPLPAGWRGAP